MPEPTLCCPAVPGRYCGRCDLLVDLPGLHVLEVDRSDRDGGGVQVVVESAARVMGCPVCGVVAVGHGRVNIVLVDAPAFGRPVRITWRKRRWLCPDPDCVKRSFVEQDQRVAGPKALLTARACWWAVAQVRRENASVHGLARRLGTSWHTVWDSIRPLLDAADQDQSRFAGVTTLGVDEHIWHHVDTRAPAPGGRGRGPKELTGMVDLSRDENGQVRARLLDLVPGRTGAAYSDWLDQRGAAFRRRVRVATLDPFHGYKNAIDDKLADATAVLDAFHVVKLGTQAVDEVRRRVQQETLGHRGRRGDPLYGIRTLLRAGAERLRPSQQRRLDVALAAPVAHEEVAIAYQCAQQLRAVYHEKDPKKARRQARWIARTFPTCPIPEIARLGRTLRTWRAAFLAYFETRGASNGGTEAINGLIELHRRIARGFRNRDNYRLRMLLIGGGLNL